MALRALSFPANFVSTTPRLDGTWYSAEREGDAQGSSAETILDVFTAIKAAQVFYGNRRYQDAIRDFKRAQSLLFRLLNSQHPMDEHLADDRLMLPVGKVVEARLADVSLRLMESLRKETTRKSAPAAIRDFSLPSELMRYQQVGFQLPGLDPAVTAKLAQGAELIAAGNGAQAVEILDEAISRIGGTKDPAVAVALAVATLNLSSAQLAQGDVTEGLASAERAAALFEELKDELGHSQALHNQASALQRSGDTRQAEAVFDASTTLFSKVRERWNEPAVEPPPVTARTASVRLESLGFVEARSPNVVAVRWPGESGGWGGVVLPNPSQTAATKENWSLGVRTGRTVTTLHWQGGQRPDAATLLHDVYDLRAQATAIDDLTWGPSDPGEAATWLIHLYCFVIPQGLGDSYHALGNYERAEEYYLQAAQYSYLHPELEAPGLWSRLARNIAAWGDAVYRDDRPDDARTIYSKLILSNGTAAVTEPLFTMSSLAVPAAEARAFIDDRSLLVTTNPAIALPILTVLARWEYLNAGLDFFGTSSTSIFTFDYLQQVARGFAQHSIQAEREYVNFQMHAEAEAASRRELQGALALADIQVQVSREQVKSAESDARAAQLSVELAQLRSQNAAADREAYRVAGYWQYKAQSIAAAHGAGVDWHGDEIRRLAADMERGSWEGDPGKLAAAATLLGGQKSYEYQLGHMDRVTSEMNAMVPIAQAQLASAQARERAAWLALQAAGLRRDLTAQALTAFENEVFTPELWARMAEAMRELASEYQYWAIGSARMMERAYNFETDDTLAIIKSSYPAAATEGLFGSDYLLRDIDSFTYHYLTHTRAKTTSLKEVVSLANDFPFQFFDLQRTGRTVFETSLLELDHRNPGFFSQRLSSVEVEMVALMPPGGVHGSLRSGTISRYRTESGDEKTRLHASDTLALSEYTARGDAFLFRGDPRVQGLFEGHGAAGTWELSLPKRSNNLDYRLITDVRLVFYYTAQFSPALRETVLTRPPLPGEMIHVRNLQPRWDFPEAWYSFLDTSILQMDVSAYYFPRNETNLRSDKIAIQILTRNGASAANVDVTLTLPGQAPATLTTNADGVVASEAGNAFAARMGGPLLGPWTIEIRPQPGSPLLDSSGALDSGVLDHVTIVAEYAFDWAE